MLSSKLLSGEAFQKMNALLIRYEIHVMWILWLKMEPNRTSCTISIFTSTASNVASLITCRKERKEI